MDKDKKVVAGTVIALLAIFGIIKWTEAKPEEVSAEILEASVEEAEEGGAT